MPSTSSVSVTTAIEPASYVLPERGDITYNAQGHRSRGRLIPRDVEASPPPRRPPPVVSPGVNTRVSIVVEGVRYGGRVDDVERGSLVIAAPDIQLAAERPVMLEWRDAGGVWVMPAEVVESRLLPVPHDLAAPVRRLRVRHARRRRRRPGAPLGSHRRVAASSARNPRAGHERERRRLASSCSGRSSRSSAATSSTSSRTPAAIAS